LNSVTSCKKTRYGKWPHWRYAIDRLIEPDLWAEIDHRILKTITNETLRAEIGF